MFNLTARQLIKILEASGFCETRRRGSHIIFYHEQWNVSVPVPLHGGKENIPIGTLMAIIKQSKLPKNKFKRQS